MGGFVLVIAEKPSLAKSIRAAVSEDYKVTNVFGHVYELAEPDKYLPSSLPVNEKTGKKRWRMEDLPIIPDRWIRHPKPDAKEQIEKIRQLLKQASMVINAGDPDREGQLLIDELLDELRYKGRVQRVWLQSLTPDAIREAFGKRRPNSEYKPLSDAAAARGRADWLVGMNLTRAWTMKSGGLISVGRVQTPTLALVVRRDLQIENFRPTDYFEVYAKIVHANGTFIAKWKPASTDGSEFDAEGRLIQRNLAERIAIKATGAGRIAEYKADAKKRQSPLPYSLSALQKAASARYGFGAKRVLDIAQELYEGQYTTYPRTDCQYLAEDQAAGVFAAMSGLSAGFGVRITQRNHPAFDNTKVTAHMAIVPTGKNSEALSGDAAKLYDMIARSTVALFLPPQEYIATSVTVDLEEEQWVASGKRITAPGWTILYERGSDGEAPLPEMKTGDSAVGKGAEVRGLQTKPPSRFTEGTLIDAMTNIYRYITDPAARAKLKETSGIGTEATRAAIIETLFKRAFIAKKGKQIISTLPGRAVVAALPEDMTDPATTARWEEYLSEIAAGKTDASGFDMNITQFVREQVRRAGASAGISVAVASAPAGGRSGGHGGRTAQCPVCGRQARRLKSKKKGAFYWACENRDHKLMTDNNGKPGAEFQPLRSLGSSSA